MKKLDLVQGSEEWRQARLNYLCASEAPAMMGDSKFMSRRQLLALKKGWQANPASDSKQKLFDAGHDSEQAARTILETQLLRDLPPVVGLTVVDGLELLASFDGYGETDGALLLWEHKNWNAILAENTRNGIFEPTYYWQLEHQMLVAGVDSILFMVSDGTVDRRVSTLYESVPKRRSDLISGWKQFLIDLDEYEIEPRQAVVVAGEVEPLPALTFSVKGSKIVSNFNDCLPVIKSRVQTEIARALETDQDFADREKLNKTTRDARAKLKQIVSDVQSEFVSYAEFADAAAEIDRLLQQLQSHGEKQVRQHKSLKKQAIINAAQASVDSHINACDEKISPMRLINILGPEVLQPDFSSATKNKRTIESLENAAEAAVAKVKILIDDAMGRVVPNLESLGAEIAEYKTLFNDVEQIVNQSQEAFDAIVKCRISAYNKELIADQDQTIIDEPLPVGEGLIEVTVVVPAARHAEFMSLLIDQLPVEVKSDNLVVVN